MTETNKTNPTPPEFCLIGSRTGPPSLSDIVMLVRHLKGREPSAEAIAEIRARMIADGYPTGEASSPPASNPS